MTTYHSKGIEGTVDHDAALTLARSYVDTNRGVRGGSVCNVMYSYLISRDHSAILQEQIVALKAEIADYAAGRHM